MNLTKLNRCELRNIARQANLTGYGKMSAPNLAVWLQKKLAILVPVEVVALTVEVIHTAPVIPVVYDDLLEEEDDPRQAFRLHFSQINKMVKQANHREANGQSAEHP